MYLASDTSGDYLPPHLIKVHPEASENSVSLAGRGRPRNNKRPRKINLARSKPRRSPRLKAKKNKKKKKSTKKKKKSSKKKKKSSKKKKGGKRKPLLYMKGTSVLYRTAQNRLKKKSSAAIIRKLLRSQRTTIINAINRK